MLMLASMFANCSSRPRIVLSNYLYSLINYLYIFFLKILKALFNYKMLFVSQSERIHRMLPKIINISDSSRMETQRNLQPSKNK